MTRASDIARENGQLREQNRLVREENESLVAQVRDLEADIARRRCNLDQAKVVVRHVPQMLRDALRHGLRGKDMVAELDRIAHLCERTAWPDGERCPHCDALCVSTWHLHQHVMQEHRIGAPKPVPAPQEENRRAD